MYNFTDGSICDTTDNMISEEGGLEEKVSSSSRRSSSATLLSQVSDVVASETWPTMKLAYRRCLVDPDPRVPALARKFHQRLLSSGSHFAMKEAFVNLAAAVTGWYQDKKVAPLLPSCGLSTECHVHTAAHHVSHLPGIESFYDL